MAYSAITAGEIDTDSPITTSLMNKFNDNTIAMKDGTGIDNDAILNRHLATGSVNQDSIAAGSIHQGELDTTTQDATYTSFIGTETTVKDQFALTSPSFSIGFQYRSYAGSTPSNKEAYIELGSGVTPGSGTTYNSFNHHVNAVRRNNDTSGGGTTISIDIDITYITGSPPYNLGDGDIPLFNFVLLDKDSNIKGVVSDESPPWVYNGPTRATPEYKRNGKGYYKKISVDEDTGGIYEEEVEVTQDIKNADMDLIPHPFILKPEESVILLDPVETLELFELRKAGVRISELLFNDYLRLDNTPVNRKSPKGLTVSRFRWRNTQSRAGEMIRDKRLKQGPFSEG